MRVRLLKNLLCSCAIEISVEVSSVILLTRPRILRFIDVVRAMHVHLR